jgi:hypothetical protein
VSGDRITAVDSQTGGAARFGNEQAIVRFVLKDKDGDGVCALALTVLVEGMNALVIKPETTASELFVALPGFSGKSVTLSATIDRGQTEVRLYRLRKESISLENGKYYVISARMKEFSEDAVDLGLPSGTLWARRNIGASSSQDAGSYFAWGETAGHGSDRTFDWENYTHSGSAVNTLTKYNNNSYYGPVVDNKTVLEEGDDAGYVLWDSFWGLPSTVQVNELVEQTDREWTSVEGLPGWRFTSKTNGNSIFIPATGYYDGNVLSESDKGYYWLNEINTGNPNQARNLVFGQYSNQSVTSLADGFWWNSNPRYRGLSVRPVVRQ